MMSNERQRHASTPVVVAKDKKQTEKNRQKKKVTLCKTKQQKTKNKIINTYLRRLTNTTDG